MESVSAKLTSGSAKFPVVRMRRLRQHPGLRLLVREHQLTTADLALPIFVYHGQNVKRPIASMPGQYQYSVDRLDEILAEVVAAGIPAVLVFGIPAEKNASGSVACAPDGIVQSAVRKIKECAPHLVVITDLCFCEYTSHGHCGPLSPIADRGRKPNGNGNGNANANMNVDVDNDATLALLAEQAVSHARAGADVIAPSGMMDGMVGAIRQGLDDDGFINIPILSYAVKFASAYYGPFRDAAESAPAFGDRRTYQMDPANGREALREALLDLAEGADMLMIKPALAYLDLVRQVKDHCNAPIWVYNVSGEYAMIKAAAAQGWIDERKIVLETLLCFKRAGADVIITYHALDVAKWLAATP